VVSLATLRIGSHPPLLPPLLGTRGGAVG
jgi:hypothetical protein